MSVLLYASRGGHCVLQFINTHLQGVDDAGHVLTRPRLLDKYRHLVEVGGLLLDDGLNGGLGRCDALERVAEAPALVFGHVRFSTRYAHSTLTRAKECRSPLGPCG